MKENVFLPILSIGRAVTAARHNIMIVAIDPMLANRMLECNTRNRRVRTSFVKYLARLIVAGKWESNICVPIVFDVNGELADGQHRLMAIVESGKTIDCFVQWDAPNNHRSIHSDSMTATLEDRVVFSNHPMTKNETAVVRAIMMWHECIIAKKGDRVHPDDLYECFTRHIEAMRIAIDNGLNSAKFRRTAAFWAAWVGMYEHDTSDSKATSISFLKSFVNDGVGNEYATRLKVWIMSQSSRTTHIAFGVYCGCVYCMRACLSSKRIKSIQTNCSSCSWNPQPERTQA